ncbi:uncharacterized protein LOC126786876 [Argentina anserina]|uniref:uncharacterized protein LOC126786876 n=1 Tax=Argentina anserina TaxID=57926 RepID=UPI0021761FB4|nr:uncharacterized protein LOC126786876 [Potentilla anserina]
MLSGQDPWLSSQPPTKRFAIKSVSQFPQFHISRQIRRDLRASAGRSKKRPGGEGSSGRGDGRIDANSEFRKEAKRNARRKTKKLAESMFYQLKNPHRSHADNFTQDELQQIGLGYDRMVRFMEKDDPNLLRPDDWYKYGEFGPYSWKGVVVGDPVRGRFTDVRVTIMSGVRDEEEWERIDSIEKFEMGQDFGKRLGQLDRKVGFRYYWVFVRHPKWRAYVDDVVKGYEKLSDGEKSRCLGFLLENHPVKLLHPYTKEWKAKLEEWGLGCDAPDSDDADLPINAAEKEFTDWVEVDDEDGNEGEDKDDSGEESDVVIDMKEGEDDVLGVKDEDLSEENDEKYWEDEFKKAATSAEAMETLAKRSVEMTDKFYERQMERNEVGNSGDDGDGTAMRGRRPKISEEEWRLAGYGPWKKRIKKSIIPPQLFLRAAVNFYTYRNLVKEIVLTRHAILDGDFPPKASNN